MAASPVTPSPWPHRFTYLCMGLSIVIYLGTVIVVMMHHLGHWDQ